MNQLDVTKGRALGTTGLSVTPLAIGCAALGDMPDVFAFGVPKDQAHDTLRASFRSPINFMDTAAIYGDGESERRIGAVLQEFGGLPEGYVLATKSDRDFTTGDFSGDQIKRSIDRSLALLGVDRIQLMHLHDPEHTTFESVMAPGGPLDVMMRYKEEGVIEHIGVAGGPIDMMIRYVETGAFETAITHNRYTLLNRSAKPLLDVAHKRGVAVINAAPYGSGILAKGPDAYARYAYQDASAEIVAKTRRLDEIARNYEVPLAAVALQFSLRDPLIASTIVGMTRPERITQTLKLAQISIPEEIWQEVESVGVESDPEAGRWSS